MAEQIPPTPRGQVDILSLRNPQAPPGTEGSFLGAPAWAVGPASQVPGQAPGPVQPSQPPTPGETATQGSLLPQTSLRAGPTPTGLSEGPAEPITTTQAAKDALDAVPWRELNPVTRQQRIESILSQLPGWNTLDSSQQLERINSIMAYYGYPPPSPSEVLMATTETLGPMVAGGLASLPAFAGAGPLGGFALRTMAPGIAETATREGLARLRPLITGEPPQPFSARLAEHATALGSSVLLDGLIGGVGGAIPEVVQSLRTMPRDIRDISERGARGIRLGGTISGRPAEPTLGRYGAAVPGGGPFGALEAASRNLIASSIYLKRRDVEGQSALQALFETFSSDIARAQDPVHIAQGLTQMIRHRDALGNAVTRSAYQIIETLMGITLIDTRGLTQRIRFWASPDMRDILARVFHLPRDLPTGEFIQRFSRDVPVLSWDDVQRRMTDLSRLALKSPDTPRGRTARALYHEMDQMVREQIQYQLGTNAPPALAVWDAARAFHSEKTRTLFGQQLVREAIRRLTKEPSKLVEVYLRNPDTTRAINQALERDIDVPLPPGIQTPIGQRTRLTLSGSNYRQRVLQPAVLEGITRGMTDQHGRVVNPGVMRKFLDNSTTARALDEAFGRGATNTLRALFDGIALMSEDRLGLMQKAGGRIATGVRWLETILGAQIAFGALGIGSRYLWEDRQKNIEAWESSLLWTGISGVATLELSSLTMAWLLNNRRTARQFIQALNVRNARDLRRLASVASHITSSMVREGWFGHEDQATLMDFWMRGLGTESQPLSQIPGGEVQPQPALQTNP